MNLNLDYEKLLKLIQGLSFTTFLILLVIAMSYAVMHLYTDNRSDWNQVQINTQNIAQMSDKVDALVNKIDKLIDGLNACLRSPTAIPRVQKVQPGLIPLSTWPFTFRGGQRISFGSCTSPSTP